MKKILLISFLGFVLSGCATNGVSDAGNGKYIADATSSVIFGNSLESARKMAQAKCSDKEAVIDSVSKHKPTFESEHTTLMFHCK